MKVSKKSDYALRVLFDLVENYGKGPLSIRELAERYATPLPQLTDEVATLAARVEEHLAKIGASWK